MGETTTTTTTTTTTCGDGDGDGDGDHHLPLLLPEDCLYKILVCLPVTSMLRFKSVCKSWRELIESSFFIDLHTITFNSSSSKFGTFILQTDEYADEEEIKLFKLSSGYGDGDGDEDDQKKMVFKVDDLEFSPFYKDFLLEDTLCMVGSCNGIICLHDPEAMDESKGIRRQHYLNLRDVSLWNPATKQFRMLPKSIPIQERDRWLQGIEALFNDFIGFGFDVKTKDYKVLRITPWKLKKGGYMCRGQVYSLSTDSWRLIEHINYLPVVPKQDQGIYMNGSYFFVGTKKHYSDYSMMLLSFDFTKEIFTTMQLPDDNSSNNVLSYLGDKMAVFTTPRIDYDGGYSYYDIWVLNEQHGGGVVVNKESWTKLHSFQIEGTLNGKPYSEPRCISNNGEFALISTYDWRDKLQLFNLVTKEEMDFLIGTQVCRADVYKESLVSIMGTGNVLLRWHLPTHGTCYKLNLDAPFIASKFPFGIGLCLTSDTGGCIGVRSLSRHVRDAEEGEALAILEAIKWAKKLELSPIIIESDSKNCLSFFMDDDDDDDNSTYWSSEALSLLREAKLLLNSSTELGSISFQYCSRSCNYVTDLAAKLGREGFWDCKEWTADFPGEMVRSLSKDMEAKHMVRTKEAAGLQISLGNG